MTFWTRGRSRRPPPAAGRTAGCRAPPAAQPDHRHLVAARGTALAESPRRARAARSPPGEDDDDRRRARPRATTRARRRARPQSPPGARASSAGSPPARASPPTAERHSRQAWMSVTRIARAPSSYSSSIIRCTSARGTIACTATQPSRCSGETVGDSIPGVSARPGPAGRPARRRRASRTGGPPAPPAAGGAPGDGARLRRSPRPADQHRRRTPGSARRPAQSGLAQRPPVYTTSAITSATPSLTRSPPPRPAGSPLPRPRARSR